MREVTVILIKAKREDVTGTVMAGRKTKNIGQGQRDYLWQISPISNHLWAPSPPTG